MGAHRGTEVQRVFRRVTVDRQTGCWIFNGARTTHGYGQVRSGDVPRKTLLTHRVLFEALVGSIPAGYDIDHLCRNPPCCNPQHLEAVTHRENILRGEAPSAIGARKTHCKNGHEFNEQNTRYEGPGKRKRHCRTCDRAWYDRKQAVSTLERANDQVRERAVLNERDETFGWEA